VRKTVSCDLDFPYATSGFCDTDTDTDDNAPLNPTRAHRSRCSAKVVPLAVTYVEAPSWKGTVSRNRVLPSDHATKMYARGPSLQSSLDECGLESLAASYQKEKNAIESKLRELSGAELPESKLRAAATNAFGVFCNEIPHPPLWKQEKLERDPANNRTPIPQVSKMRGDCGEHDLTNMSLPAMPPQVFKPTSQRKAGHERRASLEHVFPQVTQDKKPSESSNSQAASVPEAVNPPTSRQTSKGKSNLESASLPTMPAQGSTGSAASSAPAPSFCKPERSEKDKSTLEGKSTLEDASLPNMPEQSSEIVSARAMHEHLLSKKALPMVEKKRIFMDLCRQWHPDKNPGREALAKELFQHLQKDKNWFMS